MKDLSIYTASAGSGKTYQLALNYIHLLFSEPESWKDILAVTFTNKASAEMKKRILDKLFQLSEGDMRAADYSAYLIKTNSASSPEDVEKKAYDLLVNILHHYSSFYVQTIDKFFQWIIRGFTREIGLQNGYSLEFDTNAVLSEAVESIIYSMEEDEELRSWLIRFAEDKISQGKSWDINSDIINLGQEVFRENYQSLKIETPAPGSMKEKFNQLRGKLESVINDFEGSIRKRGLIASKAIDQAGLVSDDFKYKDKGVFSFFKRAANQPAKKLKPSDRIRNSLDNFSFWVKDGTGNEQVIKDLFDSTLNAILGELLKTWDDHSRLYFSAILLRNNLYTFGILNDISDTIREITRERNLFLISDSALFLKNIIQGNDAPFIYEKAGNYFSHYMLDEFQDTSRFQWENFLPLIMNSLAAGKSSLIVGDVKQSIYRWRNSDWKILASEISSSIPLERINSLSLDTNYRSAENIVAFNNSVFHGITAIVNEMIASLIPGDEFRDYAVSWQKLTHKIYGEPRQLLPRNFKNNGLIRCSFETVSGKEEYREKLQHWLPNSIMEVQDRGYRAKDITILVRTSGEGRQVVKILLDAQPMAGPDYNFNLISNDSLIVGNNKAVKFLVALFRFLWQPDDKLNTAYLKHEYLAYLGNNTPGLIDLHEVFSYKEEDRGSIPGLIVVEEFMKKMNTFRKLPLFDLSESLVDFFGLRNLKEDVAFIQAFQDNLLEFSRKEPADINSFLKKWDNIDSGGTLNVSETQDAIRIMTIHKAKGLEFNIVFVPFCDWSLYPESTGNLRKTLWVQTHGTIFNEFSHIPVLYGTDLKDSDFQLDYYEETCRTFIDNINLLYVSFTRAINELHTFSSVSEKQDNIRNAGELLHAVISGDKSENSGNGYPMAQLLKGYNPGTKTFNYGIAAENTATGEEGETVRTIVLGNYPVTGNSRKLNLNHKNIYLSELREEEKGFTGFGTQMHEIFASINTSGTVKDAVRKAWLRGLIDSGERDRLVEEISSKLTGDPFDDWFSGRWAVRQEVDIVDKEGNILRPDRIMQVDDTCIVLDYKFGIMKKTSYHEQMAGYRKTLHDAGLRNIRMFLWYYALDEIEEVLL